MCNSAKLVLQGLREKSQWPREASEKGRLELRSIDGEVSGGVFAALTNYHKHSGFNNTNLVSYCSVG